MCWVAVLRHRTYLKGLCFQFVSLFPHTNLLVSQTLAIYFIQLTEASTNRSPTTEYNIFLQWPVVARWLPTGLYVSLVNPALAHCFCWTSTPRFWCSRGSASQTNWFTVATSFCFIQSMTCTQTRSLSSVFWDGRFDFCGPCKYGVQIQSYATHHLCYLSDIIMFIHKHFKYTHVHIKEHEQTSPEQYPYSSCKA